MNDGLEDFLDFNGDGEVDGLERAAGFAFLDGFLDEEEKKAEEEEDEMSDLELWGLDTEELEMMDPEERRETIENAGLDPDDYDFY